MSTELLEICRGFK